MYCGWVWELLERDWLCQYVLWLGMGTVGEGLAVSLCTVVGYGNCWRGTGCVSMYCGWVKGTVGEGLAVSICTVVGYGNCWRGTGCVSMYCGWVMGLLERDWLCQYVLWLGMGTVGEGLAVSICSVVGYGDCWRGTGCVNMFCCWVWGLLGEGLAVSICTVVGYGDCWRGTGCVSMY